jgi:phospholipase/carboxylesterase
VDPAPRGLSTLPLTGDRDSFLYAPRGGRQPLPLLVVLHGAGGHAHQSITLLRELAELHGTMLVAPASSGFTWDVIVDDFGPDVERIDGALQYVFRRYRVDPARLAIGGFSDGASYALSIGLTNGDLFSHIVAFSPGFASPVARVDAPRVFVTHGTHDEVLPIDQCSRRIVPELRRGGLQVEYFEFDGGHQVPAEIAAAALSWFVPIAPAAG